MSMRGTTSFSTAGVNVKCQCFLSSYRVSIPWLVPVCKQRKGSLGIYMRNSFLLLGRRHTSKVGAEYVLTASYSSEPACVHCFIITDHACRSLSGWNMLVKLQNPHAKHSKGAILGKS